VYTGHDLCFNAAPGAIPVHSLERALRLQRGDFPRAILLLSCLFLVISAYVVGMVARDALFLGRFSAGLLPYADLSVFVLVGVTVAGYIRAGRRADLRQLVRGSLLAFGLIGLAFAVLARRTHSPWLFPAVYVWVGIFGVLGPAQVWTLANDALTPREARRLFGLVGSGATLGAIAGGFLATFLAGRYGTESLLALVAVLLLAAAGLVGAVWRRRPVAAAASEARDTDSRATGGIAKSLRLVVGSPHLRTVAALIATSSFVTTLSGWQLKAVAQQTLVTKDALATFFGTFNAWIGVACLVTQILLTAGILRRFGLGKVLLLLPLGLLGGSTVFLAVGSLAAIATLKVTDKVLRYSIDRPATELLYLPVPSARRIPAKSFIDTVVWRAGDGLAGLTVLAFATFGGLSPVRLTWVALPFIFFWLALAQRARRRYVTTLQESVQQHRLDTERSTAALLDRETAEVLAARLDAVDPRDILYALELLSVDARRAAHPAVRGLLQHSAPEVRCRALQILGEVGDLSVIPRAQALLSDPDPDVRTEALLFLARHADWDPVAHMADLGAFPDFSIRASIVTVLVRLGDHRLEAARLVFESMAFEPGDEGLRTRLEAARLAQRLPLPFVDGLRALLADPNPEVARAAVRAAVRHGSPLFIDALISRLGDPGVRDEIGEALAAGGDAALTALVRSFGEPATPPEVRDALPGVLERFASPEAAALLADHLLEADGTLRLRILVALGRMRDRIPTLPIDRRSLEAALGAEILGHYRSYQILGAFGTKDELPVADGLRTAMTEELERIFRLLDLLQTSGDIRSTWAALRSRDPVLRDQALDLLDHVLPSGMRSLLVPLIDPEVDESVRARLAERHGGPPIDSPAEAVRALASTADPWLRACAAYAIGALGLRELTGLLASWRDDPDPLLRETVRQAEARLAPEAGG
jgi:ATP:ADP antiporter, AAA family